MHRKRLEIYAKSISNGKLVAGKYQKLVCKRFLSDCKRSDIVWDEDLADRVMQFIKLLRHWEGDWRGKEIVLNDFQAFVVLNILCWMKNGKPRFTSHYIQIARKNGKTTVLAVLCLIHMMILNINTPQVLVGANNEDQAKICVNTTGQICLVSPVLRELVSQEVIRLYYYKSKIVSISYENGIMESMTKNAGTKDGFNPSKGVIDEYHEATTDELLNVIENGQGARHGDVTCITTAGFRREGPCYSNLRKISTETLTGQIENDTHFAMVCELDNESEAHDPNMWVKSNPMIDDMATMRPYLEDRYSKAKAEGGTKWVDFLTKNMNIWTDAPEVWISDDKWMKNYKHDLTLEWFRGKECYGGLDLSISVDLTAFVILHEDDQGIIHILPFFWLPESRLSYDKFDYVKARRDGNLFVCSGDVIDHNMIAEFIIKVSGIVRFKSIGYDNFIFNKTILQVIDSASLPFMEVSQKIKKLHPPTDQFLSLVMDEKINHGNHPVLRWNVSQVELAYDLEGAFKPSKKKGTKKIDGVMATLNGIAEWMRPSYDITNVWEVYQ